jgi:hypothetical protein
MAAIKTKSKSFSTTEITDLQVTRLMEKLNFISESEAIRYCIGQIHKKEFPDYIFNRTAADVEKRETLVSEKMIADMTDKQYADEFIGGGVVVKDKNGKEFYLIHGFGNTLYPIDMDVIRTISEEDPRLIKSHQDKVPVAPLISTITPYMVQYMQKNFEIDISDLIPDGEKDKSN